MDDLNAQAWTDCEVEGRAHDLAKDHITPPTRLAGGQYLTWYDCRRCPVSVTRIDRSIIRNDGIGFMGEE